MLAKDLLVRERSTTDARANLVQLAAAGRTALADMQPRVLAADEKILSLLSPPKRDSFVKLLRKLTSAREEELGTVTSIDSAARREKSAADKADKAAAKALKKAEKKKKPKKDKFSAKKLKKPAHAALVRRRRRFRCDRGTGPCAGDHGGEVGAGSFAGSRSQNTSRQGAKDCLWHFRIRSA